MKRAFDLIVSACALLLLCPVFLLLALVVILDSPGPAFFAQQRIGKGLKTFRMLKFRSMVQDAPSKGPFFTTEQDPRITRVGRWLRRTSADELPQVLNVLRGEMSLVGPRPDVPEQQGLYDPQEWELRHRVRPGLTGLAQSSLRSAGSFDERRALDLQYAQKHSFLTDLIIISKTFVQVFRNSGN
jgi:lipopolysaccharide/colanic/teichoic acid biosynthesis glycosyltransferase